MKLTTQQKLTIAMAPLQRHKPNSLTPEELHSKGVVVHDILKALQDPLLPDEDDEEKVAWQDAEEAMRDKEDEGETR